MKSTQKIAPIVVILDPGTLKAQVIFIWVCTIIVAIASLIYEGFLGWGSKLTAILLAVASIWIGRGRRKGHLKGCLAAYSKGIRASGYLYPWNAVLYISKYSQIRRTSKKTGVYIGESLGLGNGEINIGDYFESDEFDEIIQGLNKMREFYTNQ